MEELVEIPFTYDYLPVGQDAQDIYEEPVEILVNLVREGEINPWNIDIVEITDKFLHHIEKLERMDLRISGRTLHYAAILLRMKSNILVEEPVIEDDSWVDDSDFFDVDEYPVPKPPVRRYSQRSVTLDELILELEKAEVVERRKTIRKKARETIELARPTTEQVLNVAHEEDIEGRVDTMRETLSSILEDRTYIALSELLSGDRSNKLMTYISLLFLATNKEIWLEQEELFGELYIRYPDSPGVCS
ncbi:MAG: segregation and condensation protein A [Candidatus Methanocomedens sp.]|nr:MAG: segregation and condensation protein A [ANME-2 cluster archaeon]